MYIVRGGGDFSQGGGVLSRTERIGTVKWISTSCFPVRNLYNTLSNNSRP